MPLAQIRSYSDLIERWKEQAEKIKGAEVRLLGKIRAGDRTYPFWSATTPPGPGKKKVCLSGGIHGDEPAGAEAIIGVLSLIQKKPALLERFQFTLFPCNNPFGYEYHTRENAAKKDLNRQFAKTRPQTEVRLIKQALAGKWYDLSIEFHEDIDTPGFYLYEITKNPDAAVAQEIVRKVARKYPINLQEMIEGLPAKGGIISPTVSSDFFKRRLEQKKLWPQALYVYREGTPHCITSETPIHLDMKERVEVHLIVLTTALEGHLSGRRFTGPAPGSKRKVSERVQATPKDARR